MVDASIISPGKPMHIPVRPIARMLTSTLHTAPLVDIAAVQPFFTQVEGGEAQGGIMLTGNHFSAPDFPSWWRVIPISAVFPYEIHWIVAAAWRNAGWKTGLTRWLFPRGARVLGFTAMPPIPPDPAETEQRAAAVRQVLRYSRTAPFPVVGITPEGSDQPDGVMGELPPGVGRFMLLISQTCPNVIPVGAWKEQGSIHINFGSPYRLDIAPDLSPGERDAQAGGLVMSKIAELLPERLRGRYS